MIQHFWIRDKLYCFLYEEMWKSEDIVCRISVNIWMLADYYSYWLKTANSRVKKIFIIAYFHKEKYYEWFVLTGYLQFWSKLIQFQGFRLRLWKRNWSILKFKNALLYVQQNLLSKFDWFYLKFLNVIYLMCFIKIKEKFRQNT